MAEFFFVSDETLQWGYALFDLSHQYIEGGGEEKKITSELLE